MTGRALFNEVFIDEARVADSALIGGLNNGWRVGNTTLMVERASLGSSGRKPTELIPGPKGGVQRERAGDFVARSMEALGGVPPLRHRHVVVAGRPGPQERQHHQQGAARRPDAPVRTDRDHRLSIQRAKAGGRARAARERSEQGAGDRASAATPNIAKLTMSELSRSFRDIGLRIVGADGMLMGDSDSQTGGHIGELALFSPAPSIYGGTDQVQRNIIGERVLGLPREPGPPRDTPSASCPRTREAS